MKIDEIITVDELIQPSQETKNKIFNDTSSHYLGNLWYQKIGHDIVIAAKDQSKLLGYAIFQLMLWENKFSFRCPTNLYSWISDNGNTVLSIIKAGIKLSGEIPVLSDLEMTPSAKKFLEKQINYQNLKAKTFNIRTGDVTQYDPSIWKVDDDYRILMLETKLKTIGNGSGRTQLSERTIPIYEGKWNWYTIHPKDKSPNDKE